MAGGEDVRISDGPGLASPVLFVDAAFNRFQAAAQGKALIAFEAGREGRRVSLTLGGRDGRWASPVTGAFGGLASEGPAGSDAAFAVVEAATAWLRREAAAASIRLPPDALGDPGAAAVENALFRLGWRLAHTDINHHLDVVGPDAYVAMLNETKRKELRRLERSGAVVGTSAEPQAVYDVIAENRAAMGYPMTMAWPQVAALAEAFPDRVEFFAVTRGTDLLAGAICLRVSPACLYVFYWGERPAFRRESPVTLLARGLVAHAAEIGARILDIGVSTDASAPNAGLIAFKESLGCRASGRRTWVLDAARP